MYPSEAPIRDIIDAELKKRCVKKTVVQDIDWHARGIESGFEKAYEKVGGMVSEETGEETGEGKETRCQLIISSESLSSFSVKY